MLERLFKLSEHGTNVRTEVIAGFTSFLAMAYIIFVAPSMLASTGMDHGAVFVATCLAAAIGCLIMGLYANYPIALAPGMGLTAFFTYTVAGQMGVPWQVALGAVFLSGVSFFLLSAFKIREWIINAIPASLKTGIAAGIGLFMAIIALQGSGIVVDAPGTLVTLGDLSSPAAMYALLSFFLIVALSYRKVIGAVMIGILLVTLLATLTGNNDFHGFASMPPSMLPTLAQLDIAGAFNLGMVSIIFAFLFVDLFDTSGTLIAVSQQAGLTNERGHLPRLGRALMADSSATMVGSVMGTSNVTSYIESATGVAAGGRTGLTAVVVAGLFLVSLFLSPLATSIPAFATAGALLYVACLMTGGLARIDWNDITEAAPVVIATLVMPLTYSIANGIALGFISYAVIKLFSGRYRDLSPGLVILAILFACKYLFLDGAL